MKKRIAILIAGAVLALPVPAMANGCPDPDNPCDIEPIPSPLDPFCAKLPIC